MILQDRRLIVGCSQLLAGSILIAGASVAEAMHPRLEAAVFPLCAGCVLLGMGFVSTLATWIAFGRRRPQQPKPARPSAGEPPA